MSSKSAVSNANIASVCASCPEAHQNTVTNICMAKGIQKAYGRAGDMINDLKGKDWIPKWQAKVVMAAVTKAQTLNTKHIRIFCIEGGPNCDSEMSQTPLLKKAIVKELDDSSYRVDVIWMSFQSFVDDFGDSSVSGKSSGKPSAVSASSNSSGPIGKTAATGASSPSRNNSSSAGASAPSAATNSIAQQKPQAKAPSTAGPRAPAAVPVAVAVKAVEEHKCNTCSKMFSSATALLSHEQATGHTPVFPCPGCDREFPDAARRNQHMESTGHTAKSAKNKNSTSAKVESSDVWTCGECERDFTSEQGWKSHQAATGHQDPECPVCGKVFNSCTSLEQHCEATNHNANVFGIGFARLIPKGPVTEPVERPFFCYFCKSRGFSQRIPGPRICLNCSRKDIDAMSFPELLEMYCEVGFDYYVHPQRPTSVEGWRTRLIYYLQTTEWWNSPPIPYRGDSNLHHGF